MTKQRCTACGHIFFGNVAFEQHSCVKEAEKLSTEELMRRYQARLASEAQARELKQMRRQS